MLFYLILSSLTSSVLTWSSNSWVPGDHNDHGVHNGWEHANSFLNEWTVEIRGGEEVAQLVALELGYVYGGPDRSTFRRLSTLRCCLHIINQSYVIDNVVVIVLIPGEHEWIGGNRRLLKIRFPSVAKTERETWIRFVQKERKESYWLPSHASKLCSYHFRTDDFYYGKAGRIVLKKGAIPVTRTKVNGFPDMYKFIKYGHEKQRRNPSDHTSTLIKDRRVRWAEQLFAKSRVKRSPFPDPDKELQRVKRIEDFERQFVARKPLKPLFNDELWSHEWYLQDTRTRRNLPRLDLNVLPVYKMGYNGSGVRVSVLDDGIEYNHTDLRANYDPEISWDSNDGDPDPLPRYENIMTNSHGTRCAGEIAMTANNVKCGVGVAWGAKVGGVRMLDGRITDRVEGEAIAYAVNKVDIYSASWGPNDDGRTVEGPGRLALEAFKKGITKGRDGKGAIYVWANGNGGGHYDNCNCDGYSSSIYTISIGSASQHGKFPWYGEICSSTLATAYSSGAYKDQKIATTDTGNSCTLKHTGTSAAAPLAAGILALALQANPNLTWRDVQHLIVWTSDYSVLLANPGWQTNGVGLHFDVRFGFGLINAGALVSAALNWSTVPEKYSCRVEASPKELQNRLSSRESIDIEIVVDEGCAVNYLEHVETVINVRYSRRGALEIYLTSPQGTRVQMLSARPQDTSKAGFINWPLMSVATWGEQPQGIWILTIKDRTSEENTGRIGPVSLIIHGTADMPAHMTNGSTRQPMTWDDPTQQPISWDDPTQLPMFWDDGNRQPKSWYDFTSQTMSWEGYEDYVFNSPVLNQDAELMRTHHRNDGFGI